MTILEMSVGGALLIAAILLLRRIALYRLPKWSFLLLWVVALFRLLIPFSVPSQFSIYTGVAWIAQMVETEETPTEPAGEQPIAMFSPATVPGTFREDAWLPFTDPVAPSPEKESVSPLTAVYLLGGALCGLYFLIAYGVGIRRFSWAEPTDSDFLNQWQEEHPTLLPVTIKTCDAICSPMAYGLLRPVVLLPESTDWSDEDQLTYVLTHEYVHICRGDLGWKLLLTAALCLHWFNPLVWLMYIRANQDLELACDEAVVRILGLDNRKNYAYALIAAAESAFSPLCITYATENHMEERIRAIMKMKKKSTAVIICAAMLVAGISAVFATSPKPVETKNLEDLPSAVMTDQTVKPAPTPAPMEQDVPQNTPSAPDASAAPQTSPDVPEPDTEPAQQPVEPIAAPVADTTGTDTVWAEDFNETGDYAPYGYETLDSVQFGGWGIPEGPIAAGTILSTHSEEEAREMLHQLWMMGYTGEIDVIRISSGRRDVVLMEDYDGVIRTVEAPAGLMPDWTYPVNSKGETYGNANTERILGYAPDLMAVRAKYDPDMVEFTMVELDEEHKGSGYALYNELYYANYTGPMNTPEDSIAFMKYLEAQGNPRLVPVYDANRDHLIGYFEVGGGTSSNDHPGLSLEEARELAEKDQL